jgi:hypothetical protein
LLAGHALRRSQRVVIEARLAHTANAESNGKAKAQRQGLKHGRLISLQTNRPGRRSRPAVSQRPHLGKSKASSVRRAFPSARGLAALPFRRRHPFGAPESSPWRNLGEPRSVSAPHYCPLNALHGFWQGVRSTEGAGNHGKFDLVICIKGEGRTIRRTVFPRTLQPRPRTGSAPSAACLGPICGFVIWSGNAMRCQRRAARRRTSALREGEPERVTIFGEDRMEKSA